MINLGNEVLDVVNLTSYSSSPGFLGFSERAGKYEEGMAEQAVACFIGMLNFKSEWTLISSLHANMDEVGSFGDAEMDAADLDMVAFLCASKVISCFSYRTCFGTDYESDSYAEAVKKSQLSFEEVSIQDLQCDVLQKLLIARMLVYGLRGHLFLVSKQKGLVFYPHDDTGFGIIMFGEMSNKNFANEFLTRVGGLPGFRSVLST